MGGKQLKFEEIKINQMVCIFETSRDGEDQNCVASGKVVQKLESEVDKTIVIETTASGEYPVRYSLGSRYSAWSER